MTFGYRNKYHNLAFKKRVRNYVVFLLLGFLLGVLL